MGKDNWLNQWQTGLSVANNTSTFVGQFLNGLGEITGWNSKKRIKEAREMIAMQEAANNRAMGLQYEYNEKAADNAMQRGLDMYNQTQSPQAKVSQLEQAGLSVGLMYGGGGPGGSGASGGPQGQTSSQSAPNVAEIKLAALQEQAMALDNRLKEAQIGNINADTIKKTAEVPNIQADENLKRSEIDLNIQRAKDLAEDIENKQVQRQLNRALIRQEEVKADIAEATEEAQIQQVWQDLAESQARINQSIETTNGLKIDNAYKGKQYEAQLASTRTNIQLMEAAIEKTDAETQKIIKETGFIGKLYQIQQRAQTLNERRFNLDKDKFEEEKRQFNDQLNEMKRQFDVTKLQKDDHKLAELIVKMFEITLKGIMISI